MRPTVTARLAWAVDLPVGLLVWHNSAPSQKWLNRSRCRLSCRLEWAQGSMY